MGVSRGLGSENERFWGQMEDLPDFVIWSSITDGLLNLSSTDISVVGISVGKYNKLPTV